MNNLDPLTVTAAGLQNPHIDAETLRRIALARPDLRQIILQHPNCHAELWNFIYELPNASQPAAPHLQPYPEPNRSSWHNQSGAYATGPTVQRVLSRDDEKLWGILMHVGSLFLGFLVPLVIWLIFRDRSENLNQQGRAALNWGISYWVYFIAASALTIVFIGVLILPVLVVADWIFCILAAVKASRLEPWEYPLSIQFLKVRI